MQISLKFIQGINHAKSTTCIKFQLLVTFSSLFTGSSSLSVFARGVLYHLQNSPHQISKCYLCKPSDQKRGHAANVLQAYKEMATGKGSKPTLTPLLSHPHFLSS